MLHEDWESIYIDQTSTDIERGLFYFGDENLRCNWTLIADEKISQTIGYLYSPFQFGKSIISKMLSYSKVTLIGSILNNTQEVDKKSFDIHLTGILTCSVNLTQINIIQTALNKSPFLISCRPYEIKRIDVEIDGKLKIFNSSTVQPSEIGAEAVFENKTFSHTTTLTILPDFGTKSVLPFRVFFESSTRDSPGRIFQGYFVKIESFVQPITQYPTNFPNKSGICPDSKCAWNKTNSFNCDYGNFPGNLGLSVEIQWILSIFEDKKRQILLVNDTVKKLYKLEAENKTLRFLPTIEAETVVRTKRLSILYLGCNVIIRDILDTIVFDANKDADIDVKALLQCSIMYELPTNKAGLQWIFIALGIIVLIIIITAIIAKCVKRQKGATYHLAKEEERAGIKDDESLVFQPFESYEPTAPVVSTDTMNRPRPAVEDDAGSMGSDEGELEYGQDLNPDDFNEDASYRVEYERK